MKISLKEVVRSDEWVIKRIRGTSSKVRVDAHRRFIKADVDNVFSQWCTVKYLDKLCIEKYNKKHNNMNSYSY